MSEAEIPTEPLKPIPDSLTYPIRGDAKLILVIGSVVLALLSLASGAMIIGGAASIIGLAYFNAYYCNIVEATVSGQEEAPDWPDVSDAYGEIMLPFIRTIVLFLLSFFPMMLIVAFRTNDHILTNPLVWLGVLWGILYFPMAMLNVIVGNELVAGMPQHVLPRIRRSWKKYLVLSGLLLAGLTASMVVGQLTGAIPFIGGLLSAAVSLYFAMAQARLAGLFYREHLEEDAEAEEEENAGVLSGE